MYFLFLYCISCVSPYHKVKSGLSIEAAPTLMTTAFINSNGDDVDIGLLDMVQNKDMEEVGFHLITQSIGFFDEQGFQVFLNKEQAQQLDLLKGDLADSGKKIASVVGGSWFSQETSTVRIDNNVILLEVYRKQLVNRLQTDKENEYFLFVSASVFTEPRFSLFKRPQLVLDYVLLHENGDVVLRARGVGTGRENMFFLDKSKESLIQAIDLALESLKNVSKEEL